METQNQAIQEPVEVTGGDSFVSFDDLEAVQSAKSIKDKKADSPVVENKEKPEAKESKENKKEEKENSKEVSKDDKEKQSSKDNKKDTKIESVEKSQQLVKTLKLKSGDSETEVSSDALVPVKINGKIEQVKLQEVLNGYSGQSALDRQYASFKKEHAEFTKQRDLANEAVSKLYDFAVNKKDLRGFVEYLAGAYGKDPVQTYNDLIGSMETQIEQLAKLSPEERQAKKIQDELEYYKNRDAELRKQQEESKEKQSLEHHVEKVMADASMDRETFVRRYDELIALKTYKPEDISPELVASYHKNMAAIETVEKMLETHAPDLENKEAELERLSTYAIQLNASQAEIEEIVKQLYSNQAERKLSKKIEKHERKSRAETPVKDPQKDPIFFSDLD